MAPIAKELDPTAATQPNALTPVGAKQQPAAAEIPVTVNGARALEGTEKREPFSETTQTVLVFANGAVIRLSSPVASGQLLFLTNEKTKKEVVCQVVKSKNYSSVSGYVELEFTEAAPGFWGMRFPSNSPTAAPSAVKSVATNSAPATASLHEKIAETKTKPAEPSLSAVSKASENAQLHVNEQSKPALQPLSASPTASSKEFIAVSNFPAQPPTAPAPASKIPTLSEFLTQGAKGPQLKTRTDGTNRTPAEDLQDSKKQAARIQKENVADKGTPEPQKSLTSLLLPPAKPENPAPGSSTFDFEAEFEAEEVKIPAWLEPLARNSTANSSTQEIKPPAVHEPAAKALDSKTSSAESAEPAISGSDSNELRHFETSSPEPEENSEANDAALTLGGDGPTPNFGSSLALDARRVEVGPKASGNGLKLGLLAASLLLAAGGVWFIYSGQPKNVSASGTGTVPDSFSAPPVASPVSEPPENAKSASPVLPANSDVSRGTANPPAARVEAKPTATYGTSLSGASPSGTSPSKASAAENNLEQPAPTAAQPAEPPAKKPALGKVHLAAPMAKSRLSASDSSAAFADPGFTAGVNGADANSLSLLGSKSLQPSAPAPVGGDVKPARLLSSVAPAYPQLARSQRLSGDVKIDALVDANGKVSTMKVVSGPALLHQAAMDAVRQWKYQAATLNGQPTAMHLTVTVQFKLQ